MSASESLIPTESPNPQEKPKRKKRAQDVVFARPVFANELFTDETKEKFDQLPGWQRHLLKRVIDHGDLPRAAEEAGVSTYVKKYVDGKIAEQETVIDALNKGGLTAGCLIEHLKECLDANTIRFDKHQNPIRYVDLDLKLRTLETIFKLRGDFTQKKPEKDDGRGIEELFRDTKD